MVSPTIPSAHSEYLEGMLRFPITVNNNGETINCAMVAGLVGTAVSDSGVRNSFLDAGKQDEVRPVTGWLMFTLKKGVTRAHEAGGFSADFPSCNITLSWQE